MRSYPSLLILLFSISHLYAAETPRKTDDRSLTQESGLIIPLDNQGMYVRNETGQHEIVWTKETQVALQINFRQLANIKNQTLQYKVHSSSEVIDFQFPQGEIFVEKLLKPSLWEKSKEEALKENWMSAHGLRVYFNHQLADHLPTKDDPRFAGRFDFEKPAKMFIKNKEFEVSMKKGGQTDVLLFGLLSTKDCHPFVNRATVIGNRVGKKIIASEIHLIPIGDNAKKDDPQLPRYLYIGDSISGNYTKGLLATLQGKVNAHHPPTNCGPTGKGVASLTHWLGAYEEPGRQWDVISFNFGHWNAGSTKKNYQSDLDNICQRLKKTGARLIWVTTAPVPLGCGEAGELSKDGKAPGRRAGVMEKYLNPWAAEVIAKYPEIMVHDQWQFVKDKQDSIYREWWQGDNVHFGGKQADALGEHLGKHVLTILEQ